MVMVPFSHSGGGGGGGGGDGSGCGEGEREQGRPRRTQPLPRGPSVVSLLSLSSLAANAAWLWLEQTRRDDGTRLGHCADDLPALARRRRSRNGNGEHTPNVFPFCALARFVVTATASESTRHRLRAGTTTQRPILLSRRPRVGRCARRPR